MWQPGALLLVALLLCTTSARAQKYADIYQLHGSGTSNPAPLLWKVMDILTAGTKPRIAMSYRSIGSGSGQTEFYNNGSDPQTAFGCGDVPMDAARFNAMQAAGNPMLHVPYLVGSVSVFQNIPGVGKGSNGLFLSPCTLARIFRGDITKWNAQAIVNENPGLAAADLLPEETITVVHRNNGSSSSYALTHYFRQACPQEWTAFNMAVGVNVNWLDVPAFKTVLNSQQMVTAVAGAPYSIGYVESGQGLNAGLKEVAIKNRANTTLTSDKADVASEQFLTALFPSTLDAQAWVDVNPVYNSTLVNGWPLTLGTYFYIRKDLTYINDTGTMLINMIKFVLGDTVAAYMPDFGFLALPSSFRASYISALNSSVTYSNTSTITWSTEVGTNTSGGQADFVFAPNRKGWTVETVGTLEADMRVVKKTQSLGDAYQVHGSGSFISAAFLRQAMQTLEARARVPVTMTYRVVGSVQAQAEFAEYADMYSSYNHFKVGDYPLNSTIYQALSSGAAATAVSAVMQLPFAVTGLSVYYHKKVPGSRLNLDACTLARIYTGDITQWNDPTLARLNGFTSASQQTLLSYPIKVYAMATDSSATLVLSQYLKKACPDSFAPTPGTTVAWSSVVQTKDNQGADITTPELMAAAIAATPNSIGYVALGLGAAVGLIEAHLKNKAGSILTAATADFNQLILDARTASPALFSNSTYDLAASVDLLDLAGSKAWPMPMVQYIYMFRNLAPYGYAGPLLRAFGEYIYTDEASTLLQANQLTPMPLVLRQLMTREVERVTLQPLVESWATEAAGDFSVLGASLFTFSGNRDTADDQEISDLQAQVKALQAQLAVALPTVVHASGPAGSQRSAALAAADLADLATTPYKMTYEAATATSSFNQLLPPASGTAAAQTSFITYPGPLSRDKWQQASSVASIVQMPHLLRPVAIVYQGVDGLRITPCTLLAIMAGDITKWDSNELKAQYVGNTSLPSQTLTLAVEGPNDLDALAARDWAMSRCPSRTAAPTLPAAASTTSSVLDLVTSNPDYKYLGITSAAKMSDTVAMAAVEADGQGTYLKPFQTPEMLAPGFQCSQCAAQISTRYQAKLDSILASANTAALGIPSDGTADWSNFNIMVPHDLTANVSYPIFRFDFLVAPSDLSDFGTSGAAVLATLQYLESSSFAARALTQLSPEYTALSSSASNRLAKPGLDALTLGTGISAWPLQAASQPDGGGAIVLSRVPTTGAALATTALTPDDIRSIALVTIRQERTARWASNRAKLAFSIAVAGLVLALVLSLIAITLAAVTLARLRRDERAGGCFSPGLTKYSVGNFPEGPDPIKMPAGGGPNNGNVHVQMSQI